CAPEDVERVLETARRHGVPAARIGTVGEPGGLVIVEGAGRRIEAAAAGLADAYHHALPRTVEQAVAAGARALRPPALLPVPAPAGRGGKGRGEGAGGAMGGTN